MTCTRGFTVQHYQDTINRFLDSGYHIGPVSDYFQNKIYNKHILLRHDVDFSLDYALDMALLEKDLGVRATYYILVRSSIYSSISDEGTKTIREIKRAGHEIGLHIDSRNYGGAIEFEILARIAQQEIVQWSKHLYTITPDPKPVPEIGNVDIPLRQGGYQYIADSAMSWRNGCMCLHRENKIQLLVHPAWWMAKPNGEANRWEVLEILEAAANRKTAAAFMDFRMLLKERELEVIE